ncbi:MAG: DUF2177 family protein [Betaproteobacteria bacterium]
MTKFAAAYAAVVVVFAALDLLWLGVIAKPFYQSELGHLLAARPNFVVAAIFYLVFGVGLMIFAVAPNVADHQWRATLTAAALFGVFAYATYDLSNLATLRDWPIRLSILDIVWGGLISATAALAGKFALDHLSAA